MTGLQEPTKRLFFALWPSDELRHDIQRETRHVARHSGGRMIPARNFHITLAFLGSIAESRIGELLECARSLAVAPFELAMGRVSRWERQELLCLEPSEVADNGVATLTKLVGRLQKALRTRGFAVEHRPFRAHLTLARDVRRNREFKPIKQLRWQVERVVLVESQTLARGSEYRVLG